jgi:hypothetical protein
MAEKVEDMTTKPSGRGLTVPKNPAAMLRALNTKHAEEAGEQVEKEIEADKQSIQQTNNTTILQTEEITESVPVGEVVSGASSEKTETADTEKEAVETIPTPSKKNTPNKQTILQTNNTTEIKQQIPVGRRDGRTLRMRQTVSDPTATIVTSFRILVTTMEELDRFCFENRLRKQDVIEQALAAFMADEIQAEEEA